MRLQHTHRGQQWPACFLFFFLLCLPYLNRGDDQQQFPFAMAIHGGAGRILKKNMTPEKEKAYHDKLREALTRGFNILKNGGKSIDAVEAAIKILEDSPLFNAGKGAVFTHEETHELDASIMEGECLQAGAVAGVTQVKNPITLARKVLEKSPHVMLVGQGANRFARKMGLQIVANKYFSTEHRYKALIKFKNKSSRMIKGKQQGEDKENILGTVGAVALDKMGNLSAGTSTGGMTDKKYGRVGDSPIIGAGTYANNNSCAVSATGHGEYFIRSVVAYDIAALIEYKNLSLQEASHWVILKKLTKMGGTGGVIAIDPQGHISMPFNTEGMYRGYVKSDGGIITRIYKKPTD